MGPMEAPREAYMEGSLQKLRNTRWPHIWQKRWFVLKGKELSWAKEHGGEVLGTLQVDKLEWTSGAFTNPKELCFSSVQLNKKRTRNIELRASSGAEAAQWRELLERVSCTGKPLNAPPRFPPSPPRRPLSSLKKKMESEDEDDDDEDEDEDEEEEEEEENTQTNRRPDKAPMSAAQPPEVLDFLHQHDLRVQELRIACKDAFRIASTNSRDGNEEDEEITERTKEPRISLTDGISNVQPQVQAPAVKPDVQGLLD